MKKTYALLALTLFLAAGCSQTAESGRQKDTSGSSQQSTSTDDRVPQGNKNGWNTYVSPAQYGFSIKYPNDFGFNTDINKIRSLGYIPTCDETAAACVFYSGNRYKGTNFEGAGVSVSILKDLATEPRCYNFKVATNEAQNQVADVNINGVSFKSATGGGGAAGHAVKTQVYRNFHNNSCYEIAQRVAWTNIGNYEPGTVREFDENEIWNSLKQIVGTFEFTAGAEAPVGGAKRLEFGLGEKVTLRENQTAYLRGTKDVALKLTALIYSPCPEGAQCFWSGLDVRYELTAGGKTYDQIALIQPGNGAPYQVSVADTDYKTYATFVVTKSAPASGQVTVTGTTVCLPHKNAQPGQPQTLECAIGLKEDGSGKYYGLKNSPYPMFDVNKRVQVTGTLVPEPSSNYDIVGSIKVSDIKVLN